MKEIFRLPDSVPTFFRSDTSEKLLIEFNSGDVLYVIGTVDVRVVKGAVETWGHTTTADDATTTLYSSGLHGLISIASADGQKAVVLLEKNNSRVQRWKTFMNEYVPGTLYSFYDFYKKL